MAEFDDALFRKTVEYISVLTDKDLEIHKKDGTVTAVIYTPPAPKRHAKDRGTESTYAKPYEGKMDSGAKSRDE